MNRKPARAGSFYPREPEMCKKALCECFGESELPAAVPEVIVAGIAPHAGWMFSGATAAKVYQAIARQRIPHTFIIFGAVHVWGVAHASIWSSGNWETPLGAVAVNAELAEQIVKACDGLVADKPQPHLAEHSIEVQIPFIRYLFPDAKIVPIMVSPCAEAAHIGEQIAAISDSGVVALASTDLTHYGSNYDFIPGGRGEQGLNWVKQENDRRMLDLMLTLAADKVVAEAEERHNACGSGAIAAVLAYAHRLGKERGVLLHYTTSYDVCPERRVDSFVGYGGLVF
jgi:AmmeMemoRadiSam system protein B